MYKGRKGRKTNLRKIVRGAGKARQYNRPAKMANVVQVAKQVQRLRKQIRRDTEMKKYFPVDLSAETVAQVDINNTGTRGQFLDVVNIPAGVNDGERVGISARLKGMHFRMQFLAQAGVTMPTMLYVDIFKTLDFGGSIASIRDTIYEVDSISGVVDAQSTLNKEFVGKGKKYELVKRRKVYLRPDDYSGSQQQLKDIKFFIKQNQAVEWAGPSTATPINVQYILFLRASVGNRSSTVSTLTTVPVLSPSTGYVVRWRRTDYYIDK